MRKNIYIKIHTNTFSDIFTCKQKLCLSQKLSTKTQNLFYHLINDNHIQVK